jgi:dTDP-4-dehydrorhamnose reductase
MRILVTGRAGQVATALSERAAALPGIELLALGRPELDLERPGTVGAAIASAAPDIVVNAAAYTAVDRAEAEAAQAFAVNRDGAAAVARAAAAIGAALIHISTDYVYPGDGETPYRESDPTGPANVYGRSKLEGETAVMAAHPRALILRTAWVYSPFGANFVKSMLRLAGEREVLGVVDDQYGNPTGAFDIADALLAIAPRLVAGEGGGVYNFAGSGSTSWCGFAREIFAQSAARGGPCASVNAIATAQYPTPARRPANSRLDTSALTQRFGITPRPWQDSLDETLDRLLAKDNGRPSP